MQIIDGIVETQPPRLSMILTPRSCGKTHALVFAAIEYAQRHAGSVQIFACNGIRHRNYIVKIFENIMHPQKLWRTFVMFPNTSIIVLQLVNETLQNIEMPENIAGNVLYIDEFCLLDATTMLDICENMPNTHIIGISTPSSGGILWTDLDHLLGNDNYSIIRFDMSCQACKDAGQEDSCTHPGE